MKHFIKIKRLPMAVYNFFNMFHKDEGAHFTYNMGVGLMRLGLLWFVGAVVMGIIVFFVESPCFHEGPSVTARVDRCQLLKTSGYYMGEVSFSGTDGEGRRFTFKESCSVAGYYFYRHRKEKGTFHTYTRYSTDGKDKFISVPVVFFARREYYWANPGTSAPAPFWLCPLFFVLAGVFFHMGKKEIRVSMKYPRNDVKEDLSGAPAVYDGADSEEFGRIRPDRRLLVKEEGE